MHGGDLLRAESLRLALVLNLNHGLLLRAGDHGEGPVLHVRLRRGVRELTTDEPLRVEDRVRAVHGGLVLRGVADESLLVIEGHEGGRRPVSLAVHDDLHSIVLPDADARVGRAEVDADGFSLRRHVRVVLKG